MPNGTRATFSQSITRRAFLSSGAAAVGLVVTGCAGLTAAPARQLQLTLAPPTGSYSIGTVALHLVDHSRRDPWLPVDRPRELMVSVWYPAQPAGSYPRVPWMPAAAGALFLTQLIPAPPVSYGAPSPTPSIALGGVRLPVTRARLGAPVDLTAPPCPVVLYSPGYEADRELGTGLSTDLASRGYIVVTIDHTYEAAEVEFPDGTVKVSRQQNTFPDADIAKAATVRVADTRFVLDELARLNSGINPDAEYRRLPAGLAGALDLSATGMFGHSLGGSTAATAMAADSRISAGINLDGSIVAADMPPYTTSLGTLASFAGPVAKGIGDRPFMMMSSAGHNQAGDPTWASFWPDLSGWRLLLSLKNSGHYSYSDGEEFLSQLVTAEIIPPDVDRQVVIPAIGTIDPGSAIAAERAYIGAFFDLQLRHRGGSLLARPSPSYPQVQFLAS